MERGREIEVRTHGHQAPLMLRRSYFWCVECCPVSTSELSHERCSRERERRESTLCAELIEQNWNVSNIYWDLQKKVKVL